MEEIIIIYSLSIYNLRLPLLTTCRGDIPAGNEGDDIHGVVRSAIPTTSENGGMSWGSGTTLKRIAGEPEG
jgi:hypothetical protein